ncbi:hypothetical protein C8R43DRAFT_438222 [Mycena crocata]|nr:hypothetical protein C8R43DRAFT_438222 [Mycena crocata]
MRNYGPISRLELTYVRFEDVSGCLDFLKAAVSVRSLASWVTSLADETRSRHSENSTFLPKLVELELESDDDPLLDLLCSTSFPPRIRALSLCFGAGNISAVANLLGCLGSSLSHLQLQSFCFDTMPPDMNARDTDLSRNPNLKCIIFRRNSSHWITNILDTAAAAVPLERVYMELWDCDELLRLRSIFTAEAGALRRTEIVLFNIDIGTRSATTEWMEDMNLTEPRRVQARDRRVTLRDLRREYMYD